MGSTRPGPPGWPRVAPEDGLPQCSRQRVPNRSRQRRWFAFMSAGAAAPAVQPLGAGQRAVRPPLFPRHYWRRFRCDDGAARTRGAHLGHCLGQPVRRRRRTRCSLLPLLPEYRAGIRPYCRRGAVVGLKVDAAPYEGSAVVGSYRQLLNGRWSAQCCRWSAAPPRIQRVEQLQSQAVPMLCYLICPYIQLALCPLEREQETTIESSSIWTSRKAFISTCSVGLGNQSKKNSLNRLPRQPTANGSTMAGGLRARPPRNRRESRLEKVKIRSPKRKMRTPIPT